MDASSNTLSKAKSYLLWLLARRDYPRKQLEEKLIKRGLSSQEAKTLLQSFIEEGWFKEGAFKKIKTKQLLQSGFGPRAIRSKMYKHRELPSAEELEAAYEELQLSPESQIRQQIEKLQKKYAPTCADPKILKNKLYQSLLRRGFASSLILKELNSVTYGTTPKE